jgi:uncharacterized protein (DUF433 family)
MAATPSLIGKGIYSIPEAGKIIHAWPRAIRRWVNGYDYAQGKRHSPPVLPSPVLKIDGEEVLTFPQLIEVLFIHLFREYHISMPVIRAAAKQASIDFRSDHPFALKRLQTDGKQIFSLTPEQIERFSPEDSEGLTRNQIVKDLVMGQYVIGEFAAPYFKKIDYGSAAFEALRFWPLEGRKNVVIDPARCFGQPIDAATGVPTRVVYSMHQAGESVEVISNWYSMTIEAVEDAIAFEESLTYLQVVGPQAVCSPAYPGP